MGNPEGFVTSFNSVCPDDYWLIPFWWSRLLSDPAFRNKLNERWDELRAGPFKTETIHAYIDSLVTALDDAQKRNFERWPVLGEYVWPNYVVLDTFEEEVDWLKEWIAARLLWLDDHLPKIVTAAPEGVSSVSPRVFPNPFQEQLTLEYTVERPGEVTIELMDMIGRRVALYSQGYLEPGQYQLTVDTSDYPSGMYRFGFVFNGRERLAAKLVKP
jgi:hypothetical protein